MDTIKDPKNQSWYSALLGNITTMADQLELESEQRQSLRDFIVEVAKAQYCAGNKAGIHWLRVQMAKGGQQGAAA
ncbi:MAG: hypothetical protein AAB429_02845 [Patescibacteria group bacterium]